MPFKSQSQMRAAFGGYLGKEMKSKASQWSKETHNIKSLPQHKSMKKSKYLKSPGQQTPLTPRQMAMTKGGTVSYDKNALPAGAKFGGLTSVMKTSKYKAIKGKMTKFKNKLGVKDSKPGALLEAYRANPNKMITKKRSKVKPATAADHKLSVKHLEDSVKFNADHAKEHVEALKDDKKLLKARAKSAKKISKMKKIKVSVKINDEKTESKDEKMAEEKNPKLESKEKTKKKGNWIAGAIKKPGALKVSLGVKKGQKIPKGKLNKAAKKGGLMGKRANLAKTLASFHK